MAHFAELDENKIVLRVIVVNDENEADGENWCNNFAGGTWKQTSYNGNIRSNFAGIGYTYDAEKDAFLSPQPYPSWSLTDDNKWTAPEKYPEDNAFYYWDEPTLKWAAFIIEDASE